MGLSHAAVDDDDDRTLINLSSFQLPNKAVNQAPMLTPPPKTYVSVPFQWEEAPGKPRLTTSTPFQSVKTKSARRVLDLPPCRLFINETAASSPTTVLDGPYLARGEGGWLSFRKSPSDKCSSRRSTRWGSFRKSNSTHFHSFSSHPKPPNIIRRRPSFFSFSESSTRPHLWASIYESLKQVVPWRRRH